MPHKSSARASQSPGPQTTPLGLLSGQVQNNSATVVGSGQLASVDTARTGKGPTHRDHLHPSRLEEDLNRLHLAVNAAPDAIFFIDRVRMRFVDVNEAACRSLGYSHQQLLAMGPQHIRPGVSLETVANELDAAIRAEPGPGTIRTAHRHSDGLEFPVQWFVKGTQTDRGLLVVVVARKMASGRESDGLHCADEDRYALAALCTQDGVWDWDLRADRIYFSTRWHSMLGRTNSETISSPSKWLQLVHPRDLKRLKAEIDTQLNGSAVHFENEHRLRHADGGYRWVLVRAIIVRDHDGRPCRMVGSQTDISYCRHLQAILLRDAMCDPLTGIPSRRLFQRRLRRALDRVRRHREYAFAVFFIDLDKFKTVNDNLGHLQGDRLLREVAGRLTACVRPGDMAARLGGDEFAVLVDDLNDRSDATGVAERIRTRMNVPCRLNGYEVKITASVGIALSSDGYDQAEKLLSDADQAMYRAKALGGAKYVFFDAGTCSPRRNAR